MDSSKRATPLEWTQQSPTTYERVIDDFETFFQFIAVVGQGRPDRQNWHPAGAIKVDTRREHFVNDVKEVWKALRYDHPCFSALLEGDRWIYHVADQQELSSWLEETFWVHDTHHSARQLFPFESNPSRRVVLHVLPHTQELVLQAPHTHIDGIGMATFFNHMLSLLIKPSPATPAFGEEAANLTPPLSITARVSKHTPEQKKAWDENLGKYVSQFPTVRLHNENKGARAMATKIQQLTFTHNETARIKEKSKQLGFSVTAAAQAAISQAARIHGQVDNKTHSTFAIYDARGYVDPASFPHSQLVGPHVFAMPAVFPIGETFTETARQAYEIFVGYKEGDLMRSTSAFWATDIPATLSAPLPPDMPVAADLQLSSLGVMDKYLKDVYESGESGSRPKIEVQDFWIALDMLSPNVAVEMWTFRGELVIELIYNEAYHREESITLLLGLIQEQLRQGLGVDLGLNVMTPGQEGFMNDAEERRLKTLKEFCVVPEVREVNALVD